MTPRRTLSGVAVIGVVGVGWWFASVGGVVDAPRPSGAPTRDTIPAVNPATEEPSVAAGSLPAVGDAAEIGGDPGPVRSAAANTLAMTSARISLTVSVQRDGVTSPVSEITGEVDLVGRAASLVMRQWTAGATGEVTTVEVVAAPNAVYLRSPGLPTQVADPERTWWRTDVEPSGDTDPPVLSGLLGMLAAAEAMDAGVADVVDGATARRHRVRLGDEAGAGRGVRLAPEVVVWIDESSIVRAVEAVTLPGGVPETGRGVLRLVVARPPQPVSVTVPPPDSVLGGPVDPAR